MLKLHCLQSEEFAFWENLLFILIIYGHSAKVQKLSHTLNNIQTKFHQKQIFIAISNGHKKFHLTHVLNFMTFGIQKTHSFF